MTADDRTLIESVDELGERLARLTASDRRRRAQMIVLGLSILVDLVLSVAFFVALNRTDDLVRDVKRANNAAVAACIASNESAAKQHQLWEGVIALPSTEKSSPEALAAFRALLDTTFSQRDCSTIGKGSP